MSKFYPIIVLISGAVGVAIGVFIADWQFKDPDVTFGAQVLFGLAGAIVGGFGSKWLLARNAPQLN